MHPILLFKQNKFSKTIWWRLKVNIYGYKSITGDDLVTEIFKNRVFRLVEPDLDRVNWNNKKRILVQFYEDGYICWIDVAQLIIQKYKNSNEKIKYIDQGLYIQQKIPLIIKWIKLQAKRSNSYLWGGTLGPNFDCSGLIQTAFLKQGIFIPRDAYQMKKFCLHLFKFPSHDYLLRQGDLLFFGNNRICNHVGIYYKDGLYFHSSGKEYGRNGIYLDSIDSKKDVISQHYCSKLISAGRIHRFYRWDKTIR